ncbi:MAG TPA: hypothetical protein PK098_12165 [Phycisphaerales bacterium]|nr:hypothetical protein [Phycisphaerales bacterium]
MFHFVLMGVIIPASVGSVFLGLAWLLSRGEARAASPIASALCGAAFGAAFITSFLLLEGMPAWPLKAKWHSITLIAAAATVLSIAMEFLPRRSLALSATFIVVIVAAMLFQPPASIEQPWLWRGVLAAVAAGLFVFAHPIGVHLQERGRFLVPAVFMIAFTAASAVVMQAHFSKLAFMAGAIAATCGVGMILTLLSRRLVFAGSATAVMAVALASLLVIGNIYDQAKLPVWSFWLVGLVPLALALRSVPGLRSRFGMGAVAALVVAVLLAGAAVSLTVSEGDGDDSDYEYEYGY